MITLRLSDLKAQASLSLLLRHHELTNENVSKAREKRLGDEVQRFIFSNRPIETKTFTDLKATKNL